MAAFETVSMPLNALIIQFASDIGVRHFFIDSGSPFSFAKNAKRLSNCNAENNMTAWPLVEDLVFQPIHYFPNLTGPALDALSQRLGVPIEGVIGAQDLIKTGFMEINWAERRIIFGAPRGNASELTAESAQRLQLNTCHHFFSVNASLDGQRPLNFFIDFGAVFLSVSSAQVTRSPSTPLHSLSVITLMGPATHTVSCGHTLRYGDVTVNGLCVATGIPLGTPPILGVEFLSRHNVHFDFTAGFLTIGAPHTAPRPAWAELSENVWGPPFSVTLDPTQMNEPDRAFKVQATPSSAFPAGLSLSTPYRLRGFDIPAGPEGVNALYDELYLRGGSGTPMVLVGAGEEVEVTRTQLFMR